MTEAQHRDNSGNLAIRAKIRLDFKGTIKPGKLFFRGKSIEKVAEEIREQNVSAFRNIPLQGINILDIDMGAEVYTVFDEFNNVDIAYAPVVIDVAADTVEDLVRMVAREDFRKIDMISPDTVSLSHVELERALFRVAEEFKNYRYAFERKYNLK